MHDVQDSDEQMEDRGEESEEDEGSLYAPTEATSELGGELGEDEPKEDEHSVELPPIDSCKFLVSFPRELRDKGCALSAITYTRAYVPTICSHI